MIRWYGVGVARDREGSRRRFLFLIFDGLEWMAMLFFLIGFGFLYF